MRNIRNKNTTEEKIKKPSYFVTVCSLFIIMVLAVATIIQYVSVNELTMQKRKLNAQITVAQNESAKIAIEIEKKESYKEIEALVQSQLGLQKIESYQIDYIEIPTEDKVEITEPKEDESVLAQITNAFSVILEYLS